MVKKKVVSLLLVFVLAMSAVLGACSSGGGNNASGNDSGNGTSEQGSGNNSGNDAAKDEKPLKISMFYADNATLPFKEDWLLIQEIQKRFNVELDVEVIPIAEYQTKVSLALNTGTNVPDVILYQSTKGENASLALNGAIVPISDYSDWTPNFNARVKEFGLEEQIEELKLKDGKLYYLPALYDKPFYDGGLIMREDRLAEKIQFRSAQNV